MPELTVLTVMPARSAVGERPCVADQAVEVSVGQVSRQALSLTAVSAVASATALTALTARARRPCTITAASSAARLRAMASPMPALERSRWPGGP